MTGQTPTPIALQSPSHRYRIAQQAVASGQLLLPSQADALTRILARFLRREKLCKTEGQRRRLVERHRDLAAALDLYREPLRENAFRLEVQLLGQEVPRTIEESLRISQKTLGLYSKLFFMIPKLEDVNYVMLHAIKPELNRAPRGDRARLRFVSKLLAYFCGLDALEQLIPTGQLNRSAPWRHPVRLVRQLASCSELLELADLAEDESSSVARDPQRFATWLEQFIERMKKCLTKPLPNSRGQRSDWQSFDYI